jgi:acyl-coenzyme A synthetase/AMP-(fatty) acid ligase
VVARKPLPRNANGKIQKAELRQMALELPSVERNVSMTLLHPAS